ncbi:MAG: phosphate acyltransferase PlsX [Candidatus Coatesbacteria bacterium]|nr:phosphate acyltransferase PlsX [Candidatus Coatesbacteria bacterium]
MTLRIAIDAMGGDNFPSPNIKAALELVNEESIEIVLVGKKDLLKKNLPDSFPESISIVHAPEMVDMNESPTAVFRKKKEASINVAMNLMFNGRVDAVVSAGNTGAAMASATFTLGRLQGITRPAIPILIPGIHGRTVMIDAGANVDCKPNHLLEFAVMGKYYAKLIMGKEDPTIALLNIGEEESKGDNLTVSAYRLLEGNLEGFIGNVEGHQIITGEQDVVVCDGFIGNVLLKFIEGIVSGLVGMFFDRQNERDNEILKQISYKFEYDETGGAPLLGVNGVVIISHGKSNSKAIKNAVLLAKQLIEHDINRRISMEMEKMVI